MPTSAASLAFYQAGELPAHDLHLLMIFVGIIAGAMLVAALSLVVTGIYAARLLHSLQGISIEVKERIRPLLNKTHAMIEELSPRIQHFTENAEQISLTLRSKMEEVAVTISELNRTVQETNLRTRTHISHVDGIVTGVLNTTEEVTNTVRDGIRAPLRQMSSLLAGVKSGLEKLAAISPFGRQPPPSPPFGSKS